MLVMKHGVDAVSNDISMSRALGVLRVLQRWNDDTIGFISTLILVITSSEKTLVFPGGPIWTGH